MEAELTCYRCGTSIPSAVDADTGGLCRTCQKTIPDRVELRDLIACMRGNDNRFRSLYFERFSKRKPPIEALPILRQAVLQDAHALVKSAATAIGKLKEKGISATDDLLTAAARVDANGMPQSYPECLSALVAIDESNPQLIPLIRKFKGLDNWVPMSASLKALAAIGTVEAIDLLHEICDQHYPEMDKMQKRFADAALAEGRSRLGGADQRETEAPGTQV